MDGIEIQKLTDGEPLVAVSKLKESYGLWLRQLDKNIRIIDLYTVDDQHVLDILQHASGILLTGGNDIDPAVYGKPLELKWCRDIDNKRDTLELGLVDYSFRFKLPLLAICRGQQILNVARGGSLITHIPEFTGNKIKHSGDSDVFHKIKIRNGSGLHKITGVTVENVNSSHHQALEKIAPGFKVTAHSEDDIVEAIELAEPLNLPFCIAVQWHPERLDIHHPLSGLLGKAFLAECHKHYKLNFASI